MDATMEDASFDCPALQELHDGQEDLIDIISETAAYGKSIQVPCIAVVGDLSSGKSSVLEAITGLRFPVKDGIGTRFPVELHLCPNSHGEDATFNVRIQSQDSSKQEEFEVSKDSFDENDISAIIDAAERTILEGGASFSEDALIVNMRGPGVPHLSLVDLPGFYPSSHHGDQSTTDREIVDRLMERYMTKCLILAVVSAQYPAASQQVLSEVKRYDEHNTRTLGIITKPDLSTSGIKNENDFMCFVKNIDESAHSLAWGWHILRNRSSSEISDTNEQRDQKEESFFESSHWSNVLSRNLGAQSLRIKLNNILLDYAKRDVHNLSKVCREVITECKSRLTLLGEPRSTTSELRAHLEKLASRFHTLCLQAVDGSYGDAFFGGLFPEHETGWFEDNRIRKLQALLRDQNRAFVHVLSTQGSKRIILPKDSKTSQPKTGLPTFLQELVDRYDFEEPAKIAFKDIAAHLQLLLPAYQGREFPGTANDALVVKLFREQSQPWEAIARRHIQIMLSMTEEFVKKLVYYITNPDLNTFSRIITKIVEPFFEMKLAVLESKLQELLCHYKSGRLQVLDTEFRALLTLKRRKNGHTDQVQDLFGKGPGILTQESRRELGKADQPKAASGSEIDDLIDKSETYYEMSLRTFTDNVVILAVENCLIRDLPSIIATDKFKQMTDDEIEQLASEAPDIQEARQQQHIELRFTEECLQTCLKWKMKPMPPMSFELGDLFTNAYLSEYNRTTVLDDESMSLTIGDGSGASNASTQTEQLSSQSISPEASTKIKKIAIQDVLAVINQNSLCYSPLPPTLPFHTAPLVSFPIRIDAHNPDFGGDFMNICVHESYSKYSPEELRVFALF